MKLSYMKTKLIAFISFWVLMQNVHGQQLTASNDSLIIIDYAKAFRIQTDLISIPVLKQIISAKEIVIQNQNGIIEAQNKGNNALKLRINTLEAQNKNKTLQLRKRGLWVMGLTTALVIETYIIIFSNGIR